MKHRFSGWPGAWCLDCGCEDKNEIALADGIMPDSDLNSECLEPGSNRHNPYFSRQRKWDIRFLNKASFVASWSKDPSTKCGAVIVRDVNMSVQDGYNGYPPGVSDDDTLNTRENKYLRMIHAEVNAILLAKQDISGYTLYVYPLAPCARCAVVIIQAGIKRVVSVEPNDEERRKRWEKENEVAFSMFKAAGVEVTLYDESLVNKYIEKGNE